METKPFDYLEVPALDTRPAFLEHDRYPMAWEQLLGSLQSLGLISSKDRRHSDALGKVSDHVEQQAHGWCGQLMVV